MRGDEPAHPVTQYGRSKLAGEAVVRGSNLPWTIIRPPAVYGPGDREMLRVFRAASLGVAPVFGDGLQQLSLVFGPDLADALVAARLPGAIGGTFYPAHPEVVTTRQLIETVGAAAGKRPFILPIPLGIGRAALGLAGSWARLTNHTTILTADKANELFQPRWVCDPSPLTAATGWRAEHHLAAGARLTLDWYRRERWL
jgi:nucleoside-diphosphate-sugar epimerase